MKNRNTGTTSGGSGEIRTHGWLPIAGFQDQCLKPLGHASLYPANQKWNDTFQSAILPSHFL